MTEKQRLRRSIASLYVTPHRRTRQCGEIDKGTAQGGSWLMWSFRRTVLYIRAHPACILRSRLRSLFKVPTGHVAR